MSKRGCPEQDAVAPAKLAIFGPWNLHLSGVVVTPVCPCGVVSVAGIEIVEIPLAEAETVSQAHDR